MEKLVSNGIPILTYHSVDESESVISVSAQKFERQIRYLNNKGYSTLSLSKAVDFLTQGITLPRKNIIITFDDGYKNNYTEVLPILKKYNFTATIFLTTDHCGKINNWQNQHSSIPELPMLSWEEANEMVNCGIEFGAHTQKHVNLTYVSSDIALKEIMNSKDEIEKRVEKPVKLLSYPFGAYNKKVQDIARKYFIGAISNKPGKINANSDVYALERINATGQLFKLIHFNFLFFGSFSFYLILKKFEDGLKIKKKLNAFKFL
jgi:peptidoglycan/xylan/chitin deacetylase (PgdA/CDA1 family)